MRDEQEDRLHQALRQEFARDIAEFVRSVAFAFERLTARLYDAPWTRRSPKCGSVTPP